jgi:hypothetical protein
MQIGETYELLTKLENLPYFQDLLNKGIIPINLFKNKEIYEFYLAEKNKLQLNKWTKKKTFRQAKSNTSEKFKISERSVYLIIQKMES